MKRIISIILTMLMLLSLLACGKSAEPTWQEQYDLGVRYLAEGNYEEAIIAFTAAIEIDPKQATPYIGRADAYIGFGETDENLATALADYEKAIALDETNEDAWLGIADVYIRYGEFDKAEEVLEVALEKTGNASSIAEKIAEIEQGTIRDSSQNIRCSKSYNTEDQLTSYTLYKYDQLGRRIGWENWSYEEWTEEGEYILLDTPYLENSCAVTFNDRNLQEQNNFYDENGVLTFYDSFIYNDKGLKIEQHRYFADGEKDCYFLFYYNEKGQETKYEGYRADGEMYAYWISEYDDEGNFIRETHYEADGTMIGYNIVEE